MFRCVKLGGLMVEHVDGKCVLIAWTWQVFSRRKITGWIEFLQKWIVMKNTT